MIIDTDQLDSKTKQMVEMILHREPENISFGKPWQFFDKVEVQFRKATTVKDALSGLSDTHAGKLQEEIETEPDKKKLKRLMDHGIVSSKDTWICTFSINGFNSKYGTSVSSILEDDKQTIKQLVDAIDAKFGLPGIKLTYNFIYQEKFDDWYNAKIWLETWEKFYEIQHREIKKFIDEWLDSYIKASVFRRIKFWFEPRISYVTFRARFPFNYLAEIPDWYHDLKDKFKAKKVEQATATV
jgi:hypothetical protein